MTPASSQPAGVDAVPGIDDPSRLAQWIAASDAAKDAGELRGLSVITGGRSNLTYTVELAHATLVLRRPPLGHVLPTAHDMVREYRVLSALDGTDVPVPHPVALCDDTGVIGAQFYLMDHVAGESLRTRDDSGNLTPGQRAELSELTVQTMAAIHGVDPAAVGLADFGRPDGFMERQLRRWGKQWDASSTREMPAYDRLVRRLGAAMPDSPPPTLIHGDFRLDNMLITLQPRPEAAAVIDWEMSTLGDPLSDLGLTLTYWAEEGEENWLDVNFGASVSARPGFLTRREMTARYAELTGRDVSNVDFYMAFGCFKLAVVLEGIHARYLQRMTVGEGFEREGKAVPTLIDRAHQLLDEQTS